MCDSIKNTKILSRVIHRLACGTIIVIIIIIFLEYNWAGFYILEDDIAPKMRHF